MKIGPAVKAVTGACTAAMLAWGAPAFAQDNQDTQEIYHIFKLETDAPRGELIKALRLGLKENTTDTQVATPLVRGEPPEKPGSFELINPLSDGRFGALGALLGAGNAAEIMQVQCNGAVWIANGQRRLRGSQRLRITLCLFPMKAEDSAYAYHLDVYVIDVIDKGGGLDRRLGRAIAGAFVGKPQDWTNKTILDVLRSAREDAATKIIYVEGQPAFEGTPWDGEDRLIPSDDDKRQEP